MLKILLMTVLASAMSFLAPSLHAADMDHAIFDAVLKEHVTDGRADYKNLCADKRLGEYLKELSRADLAGLTQEQEIALWLNAYNAYMLKIVCDHYPLKNLDRLHFGGLVTAALLGKTVWDRRVAVIGGVKYTLKKLDHGIIRRKFKDPRLQFGMSCGAVSCPQLRWEAYNADKLDEQLTDQAKHFFNDPLINTFGIKSKNAQLSPLMNWNAHYFGKGLQEVLAFIAQFVPPEIGQSLKEHPEDWTVTYGEYDLTVNDKKGQNAR